MMNRYLKLFAFFLILIIFPSCKNNISVDNIDKVNLRNECTYLSTNVLVNNKIIRNTFPTTIQKLKPFYVSLYGNDTNTVLINMGTSINNYGLLIVCTTTNSSYVPKNDPCFEFHQIAPFIFEYKNFD
jgi:hypothetical protein